MVIINLPIPIRFVTGGRHAGDLGRGLASESPGPVPSPTRRQILASVRHVQVRSGRTVGRTVTLIVQVRGKYIYMRCLRHDRTAFGRRVNFL
jgi:hypothetical protein